MFNNGILDFEDVLGTSVSTKVKLKPKAKVVAKTTTVNQKVAKLANSVAKLKETKPVAKLVTKPVAKAVMPKIVTMSGKSSDKVSVSQKVAKLANSVAKLKATKPVTKPIAKNLAKLKESIAKPVAAKISAPADTRRVVQTQVVGSIPQKVKALRKKVKKVVEVAKKQPVVSSKVEQKIANAAVITNKMASDLPSVRKDIAVEAKPAITSPTVKDQIISTLNKVNDTIINERDIAFKKQVLNKLDSIDRKVMTSTLAYQGAFL